MCRINTAFRFEKFYLLRPVKFSARNFRSSAVELEEDEGTQTPSAPRSQPRRQRRLPRPRPTVPALPGPRRPTPTHHRPRPHRPLRPTPVPVGPFARRRDRGQGRGGPRGGRLGRLGSAVAIAQLRGTERSVTAGMRRRRRL